MNVYVNCHKTDCVYKKKTSQEDQIAKEKQIMKSKEKSKGGSSHRDF